MSKTIGINLGSHIITVYIEGQGIVLREPNAVAVDAHTREVVACGQDAINLFNKTPGAIELISHIYHGNVSDYERMAMVMKKIFEKISVKRPDVIFTVHGGHSSSDISAISTMMMDAGAKRISVVELPGVAVMGAGLPLNNNKALLLCDIGAATTEIGIVKGCATKLSHTIPYGCNLLDEALKNYIKSEFGISVTERTARKIREAVGSVHPDYNAGEYAFIGKDTVTGLPCESVITSDDTREVMVKFADYLVANIKAVIEKLPEQVVKDIKDRGILLTGGGALDGGIGVFLEEKLDIDIKIAENPIECSVKGLGMIIENKALFHPLILELSND
ncbi:MAG: rod shape-determining protein [Clostridia bacterium]|nr:rod shape-determining protein [Clostridia bacterium]